MRWEKPESYGIRPLAREGFGMLEMRGNYLILFGGYSLGAVKNDVYTLDLLEMKWNEISTFGAIPLPRQGFCSFSYRNKLIIVSGCDYSNKICFNEIY
jgi:hypothetical protein